MSTPSIPDKEALKKFPAFVYSVAIQLCISELI